MEGEPAGASKRIAINWQRLALLYAFLLLVGGALVNDFFQKQSAADMLLWAGIYLPIFVLPLLAGWSESELGLTLDGWTAVVSAALLLLLAVYTGINLPPARDWSPWLAEGFARTGEEFFFRGLLFALALRLARERLSPLKAAMWALALTSLLFALVHAPFYGSMGGVSLPVALVAGLALGLLRLWTGSVLPGIMVHAAFNAGIPGMIVGVAIYFIVLAVLKIVRGNLIS